MLMLSQLLAVIPRDYVVDSGRFCQPAIDHRYQFRVHGFRRSHSDKVGGVIAAQSADVTPWCSGVWDLGFWGGVQGLPQDYLQFSPEFQSEQVCKIRQVIGIDEG